MPSAETRIKVALKRELALFDVWLVGSYICSISFDVCEYSSTGVWWEIYQLATVTCLNNAMKTVHVSVKHFVVLSCYLSFVIVCQDVSIRLLSGIKVTTGTSFLVQKYLLYQCHIKVV